MSGTEAPAGLLSGEIYVSSSSDAIFTMKHCTLGIEDTLLLKDAALVLQRGHRYGIVGENGCGKSTLLRAIRDVIEEESVSKPQGDTLRVMYVGQNDAERAEDAPMSVLDYVVSGDLQLTRLQKRLAELENGDASGDDVEKLAAEMENIMIELDARDSEGARQRAEKLLTQLGIPAAIRGTPLGKLSGGWRTRLQIARALFAKPDLLMLDEPSNHLDLASVLQLGSLLHDGGLLDGEAAGSSSPMTIVVVS